MSLGVIFEGYGVQMTPRNSAVWNPVGKASILILWEELRIRMGSLNLRAFLFSLGILQHFALRSIVHLMAAILIFIKLQLNQLPLASDLDWST